MGTIWVREFTGGLDTRRLPETSKGGTLVQAVNGHINRGGEFEQRAAFVPLCDLPKGVSIALAYTPGGLVVFGSEPTPANLPAAVTYQRLVHKDGSVDLLKINSYDLYAGKLFVSATFVDGTTFLFYDGVRVTKFGTNTAVVPGTFVRTFGRKMYYLTGPNLIYSNLAQPDNFDADTSTGTSTGAGFNDLSEEDYGSEGLVAIGRYQNFLAMFSDRTIQIRYVDPDPALSKAQQSLHNTGTASPRSVTQFGDSDLFYLDSTGLRSLKARDASNSASTSDIGSAIDTLLTEYSRTVTDAELTGAIGLIEPRDGRFWLAIGTKIFVFSYFPAAKVSAWTIYEPGFKVDDIAVFERRVYLRSGDKVYVYGGVGKEQLFDDTAAVAWLPYLDADRPTETKQLQGVDVACRGTWLIEIGMDPSNLAASDKVGTVEATTYMDNRIPASHAATHFSVRATCRGAPSSGEPAVLSSVALTYSAESDKAKP